MMAMAGYQSYAENKEGEKTDLLQYEVDDQYDLHNQRNRQENQSPESCESKSQSVNCYTYLDILPKLTYPK